MTNSGWLLFDKLIRAFSGLIIGAWVARYLGPSHFGMLAYVIAFIAMFQAIASLSADAIAVRDIAQKPEAAPEILGSLLALRIGAGALSWILAMTLVAGFEPSDSRIVLLTAIVGGTLVFQSADTVDLWFQSQSQSRRTVVAKLIAYLLTAGVKGALILSGSPLEAFAAVVAFESLACTLSLIIAYRRFPTGRAWLGSWARAQGMIKESMPFMLSGVSIALYSRIDQIMIKQMLDERSLGIYAAALPLSQFWQVIPMTLASSLAPFIARRKVLDEREYRRSLVLIFRLFFYTGAVTSAVTWGISHVLVGTLFGSDYAGAVQALNVHSISNVFCFLGIAHGLWLVNERRFAVRLYGTLLAGISTVVVNYLLLPRIGVVGAAYAAIVAQFVAAMFINAFLDRESLRLQWNAIAFGKA